MLLLSKRHKADYIYNALKNLGDSRQQRNWSIILQGIDITLLKIGRIFEISSQLGLFIGIRYNMATYIILYS